MSNESDNDDQRSSTGNDNPLRISSIFGSLSGTFSPSKRSRSQSEDSNQDDKVSMVVQSFLVGILCLMVLSAVSFSFLAYATAGGGGGGSAAATTRHSHTTSIGHNHNYVKYSLAHRVNHVDANILGLYHIQLPQSIPDEQHPHNVFLSSGTHANPQSTTSSTSTTSNNGAVGVEAFFLRYFVVPLQQVQVKGINSMRDSIMARVLQGNDSDFKSLQATITAAEQATTTTTTTTTEFLPVRYRLLHTIKTLYQEFIETTQKDILHPLTQRWIDRVRTLKRLVVIAVDDADASRHSEEDDDNDDDNDRIDLGSSIDSVTAVEKTHSETAAVNAPPVLGGAVPGTIFSLYPVASDTSSSSSLLLLLPSKKTSNLGAKIKRSLQDKVMYLPRINVGIGRGNKSRCPTSLFCYYRLPPTTVKSKSHDPVGVGVVCPRYCGRCLETKDELKQAVEAYIKDPSHDTYVADTYGWPIGNWCVSMIKDFTDILPADFHEDLRHWGLSQ